jgi:hypothetical protein
MVQLKPMLAVILTIMTGAASANKASDMLSKMSDDKRNESLSAYMKKSGESCQVVRNFYQGKDKSGSAFWNVECASKTAYAIMIKNDQTGSTTILDCKVLKLVAKVDCFKKF